MDSVTVTFPPPEKPAATTWLLVTMYPSSEIIKPEPVEMPPPAHPVLPTSTVMLTSAGMASDTASAMKLGSRNWVFVLVGVAGSSSAVLDEVKYAQEARARDVSSRFVWLEVPWEVV